MGRGVTEAGNVMVTTAGTTLGTAVGTELTIETIAANGLGIPAGTEGRPSVAATKGVAMVT